MREHTDLPENIIKDLVLMKLNAVGLRGAYKLMPTELSGGMARRVALARAIALDPDYLLAYENLVVLSQKIKDFNATKLYLHKILEIDPKHKAKQILESL
jgi:ABC-type nitrate/sulfonate/bicarbonate transport system ATPase subunit